MKDYSKMSISDFLDEILRYRITKVEIRIYINSIIRLFKNYNFLNDYLIVISGEMDNHLLFKIQENVNIEEIQKFKEALFNNYNSEDIWYKNRKGEYQQNCPNAFSISDITNKSFKSKISETVDLRAKIDVICQEFGSVTFSDDNNGEDSYCQKMIDLADILQEEFQNLLKTDNTANLLNSSIPIEITDQKTQLDVLLKQWILPDNIDKFIKIEKELLAMGYIDNLFKWEKTKIELAEFSCVLIHYKLFRPLVNRKRIQDFHKRQFISERYGFGKTGLTETWKKTKPTIKESLITYFWIESLINSRQ